MFSSASIVEFEQLNISRVGRAKQMLTEFGMPEN